ncbi:T9SS type B sorting domain-containing protein [Gelidibacter gilvus]|uniref:T9SS type B sorting domain-containing protein n=2 Tax=Gelidibacter maritimus TaxID=2761487 RepID=A0A7W2M5D4_9FLAO|nr:T9SS type B sorting domain-containing protein [Gelidibacter maritimus]
MIQGLTVFFIFIYFTGYSQNVQVDSQTYTAQQLIEDIFINSNCVQNVVVTNVVGGSFNSTDKSYGYFDASGTTFPIQRGVVMSTGRLSNVPGPNTSISDDDAINWDGDSDLERSLSEGNTINATILEFDFVAASSQISFRYLFASEEYQENNTRTCRYSDLFGFLIRSENEQEYTNIALIPGSQTPVKVTTVHSGVPDGCDAINETYFGGWNNSTAPINFNGQTEVLTATANIIPNQNYHVKLVIADAQNYRYDSAIFLEANSFELKTNLGVNRLVSTNNPVCEGDSMVLNAVQPGNLEYVWYKDGALVETQNASCPNCGTYAVTGPGTYGVEVTLANGCKAYGEIIIEYATNPLASNAILLACDENQDGITFYNLLEANTDLTNNDDTLIVSNFYTTYNDAVNATNAIPDPANFQNSSPAQTVFARVENQNRCFTIGELTLEISNTTINAAPLNACKGPSDDLATFDLNQITADIQNQIPTNSTVQFYENEADAFTESNSIGPIYTTDIEIQQTIYIKINSNSSCYALTTTQLNVLHSPLLEPDETILYCLNSYPDTIRLFGGIQNTPSNAYRFQWFYNGVETDVDTSFIDINAIGTYTVNVTGPNGCSNVKNITVIPSDIATIEAISIIEGSNNNSIEINVSGDGDYEFAFNKITGPYQDSNVFTALDPGIHTIYVRDKKGCGISKKQVSILGFPKYFTPNGDGINDIWSLYGITDQFSRALRMNIYNRYGKLIFQQTKPSGGWDGTYSGTALPANDYWFEVILADGTTYTGHFSLVR